MTQDLAAFLTARLDEEERVSKLAAEIMALRPTSAPFGFRLPADIDAKRRIIELHGYDFPYDPEDGPGDYAWTPRCNEDHAEWPCPTLYLIALSYADHPDYDESWRP